jgi:2-isopropylmalate synthase
MRRRRRLLSYRADALKGADLAADNASPVLFFDTTLRDGEQAPGCSLAPAEKLRIALQLARLQVDVIEAGFPASGDSDFLAVRQIAQAVSGPVISGLARCVDADILACWEAIKVAARPRLHVFLGTSDIHLRYQMEISRETAVELVRDKVALAASLCPSDVQFSAMDATRSDAEFLAAVVRGAIASGATTVNLSDTVGYCLPGEWRRLIDDLRAKVPELNAVALSIHCHNDLGLATANSLAAIEAGATQVEVAVNGLGERAGVAALEEVAMALVTRGDVLCRSCRIVMAEIPRASRLVSELTGVCSAQMG